MQCHRKAAVKMKSSEKYLLAPHLSLQIKFSESSLHTPRQHCTTLSMSPLSSYEKFTFEQNIPVIPTFYALI